MESEVFAVPIKSGSSRLFVLMCGDRADFGDEPTAGLVVVQTVMAKHKVGIEGLDRRTSVTVCLLWSALLHAIACAPVSKPVGEVCDWRVVHNLVCTTVVQCRACTYDVLIDALQVVQSHAAAIAKVTALVRLAKVDVFSALACGLHHQCAGELLAGGLLDLLTQSHHVAVED